MNSANSLMRCEKQPGRGDICTSGTLEILRLPKRIVAASSTRGGVSFFANARNLGTITPPWLKFEVITPDPIEMRPGALIDYRIRIHGLPVRWRTEITEWNPPHGFVDVQLRGPYKLWQHTHTFEERDGGTLCIDHVNFRPLGGALMNRLFVRRDIERITNSASNGRLSIIAVAVAALEKKRNESPKVDEYADWKCYDCKNQYVYPLFVHFLLKLHRRVHLGNCFNSMFVEFD